MKIITLLVILILSPSLSIANEHQSTCYGTTANGRLENGVSLPSKGPNFESYTSLGGVFGRTYVHSRVRDVVADAYKALETLRPGTVYVYGEAGKKQGGPFRPHKTHQNGLSVDFMVPVLNSLGRSIPLPANALNRFGYNMEFDGKGRAGNFHIDFEAMADHILALKSEADRAGIGIWRVIFDPKLQPMLFETGSGHLLQEYNINFSKKRSWVRHDEHYHVDFDLPCEPL
ncbi:MAG: penicillin-insensitive murein endopeptidase [Pseudomonadota bacterium]|jgi:penicillin-insensitive murein endopeptidase